MKLKGHNHVRRVEITNWLWEQIPKKCKEELAWAGNYHKMIPLALAEAIASDVGVDMNLFAQEID